MATPPPPPPPSPRAPPPQAPSPQAPYPAGAPATAAPPSSAGMATAALVCGIAGVVLFFLFVPSVVAIVLGAVAADRARKHPHPGDRRAQATAGWILGIVGVLGFVALMIGVGVTGGFEDDEISVVSLEAGDCVDLPEDDVDPVEELDRRDCDEPHDAEVYLVEDVTTGGDEYPGRDVIDAEVVDACEGDAFEEYVGADFTTSRFLYFYLYPVEDGWELGDREYVCLVITPDGSPLTRSVEGSEE